MDGYRNRRFNIRKGKSVVTVGPLDIDIRIGVRGKKGVSDIGIIIFNNDLCSKRWCIAAEDTCHEGGFVYIDHPNFEKNLVRLLKMYTPEKEYPCDIVENCDDCRTWTERMLNK